MNSDKDHISISRKPVEGRITVPGIDEIIVEQRIALQVHSRFPARELDLQILLLRWYSGRGVRLRGRVSLPGDFLNTPPG